MLEWWKMMLDWMSGKPAEEERLARMDERQAREHLRVRDGTVLSVGPLSTSQSTKGDGER